MTGSSKKCPEGIPLVSEHCFSFDAAAAAAVCAFRSKKCMLGPTTTSVSCRQHRLHVHLPPDQNIREEG